MIEAHQRLSIETARRFLRALLDNGYLIGVEVFGEDDCCEHGREECPSDGFGLCDTMHEPWSVGSDCNRAKRFLMRPHDDLMTEGVALAIADNWREGIR